MFQDGDTLKLTDGRKLCWSHYGDPLGSPVLYFHGWPGSRLEARLMDPLAQSRGIRLISVDRPGMGGSDFHARRKIIDWPADVEQLVNSLKLSRFGVLGVSGGCPYALACAWALPQRLTTVAIMAGMGPPDDRRVLTAMSYWNRLGMAGARYVPRIARGTFAGLASFVCCAPNLFLKLFIASVPKHDRKLLRRSEFRVTYEASLEAIFRQGKRGPAWDGELYCRSWGFALNQIRPTIQIWHGGSDANVPVAMARLLASRLQNCHLRILPGEGHFSLVENYTDEVLECLAAGASGALAQPEETL